MRLHEVLTCQHPFNRCLNATALSTTVSPRLSWKEKPQHCTQYLTVFFCQRNRFHLELMQKLFARFPSQINHFPGFSLGFHLARIFCWHPLAWKFSPLKRKAKKQSLQVPPTIIQSPQLHTHRTHGTGIFTNNCHKSQPNVGKYTIHGSYWICFMLCFFRSHWNIHLLECRALLILSNDTAIGFHLRPASLSWKVPGPPSKDTHGTILNMVKECLNVQKQNSWASQLGG